MHRGPIIWDIHPNTKHASTNAHSSQMKTINTPGWLLVWISSMLISLHEDVDVIVQMIKFTSLFFSFNIDCSFPGFFSQCALKMFVIRIKVQTNSKSLRNSLRRTSKKSVFIQTTVSLFLSTSKESPIKKLFRNEKWMKIFGKILWWNCTNNVMCVSFSSKAIVCRTHRMIELKWVPYTKYDDEKKLWTAIFFGCWCFVVVVVATRSNRLALLGA